MQKILIHQIYYDWPSRRQVLPGFIPLDNSRSLHPDWFELWPILDFLNQFSLDEDCWYGFLSPKFREKTLFDSKYIFDFIENNGEGKDVALFSHSWDQLAYFKNPWEQGELWHPGITSLTQRFLDDTNRNVRIDSIVTDSQSSVFSNFVVAKKEFWTQWHAMAAQFYAYVEAGTADGERSPFADTTSYGSKIGYPMKTFVQERFVCLLLATQKFNVITPEMSLSTPIYSPLFRDGDACRRSLQSCDFMKSCYRNSGDTQYLDMYLKIRASINFTAKTN